MLFIHEGLQDKLIATRGYCIMNTDEGTGFLDDMTKKEVKHESNISLMNQLFDGKGEMSAMYLLILLAFLYQYSHNLSVRLWQKCKGPYGLRMALGKDSYLPQ